MGKKFGDTELTPKSLREIIGVVDDVKEGSLDSEIWPAEYDPLNQNADTYVSVVVRTSQDEKAILPTLTAAIHQIDPGIGVFWPGYDESTNQRFADCLYASVFGLAGGWVCCYGVAAGCCGALWGDCLFGEPEDSRDRREDGFRRAEELGVPDDSERGRVADGLGDLCGIGLLSSRGYFDEEGFVWHTLVGYAYAGGRGRCAWSFCSAC